MGISESEEWFAHAPAEPRDIEDGDARPASREEPLRLTESEEFDAQQQVIAGVSTGALLDAMENPEVFEEVARGDLYVQLARLRQRAPDFTVTQHMDYTKFLAKLGKVDQPDRSTESPLEKLPMINIQLPDGANLSIGAADRREKDVTPTAET